MRICVYCGSSVGNNPAFIESAQELGKILAQENIDLVWGGANVGLMGTVASTAHEYGAMLYGVLPRSMLQHEIAFIANERLEMSFVDSLHERKFQMSALADGFICLPGGLGTLEEFLEMATWGQLGVHNPPKPCYILNIEGFFDPLVKQLERCRRDGFIHHYSDHLHIVRSPREVITHFLTTYKIHQIEHPLSW